MNNVLSSLGIVCLLSSAIPSYGQQQPHHKLIGTSWIANDVHLRTRTNLHSNPITLTFSGDEISGNAGCNDFFGDIKSMTSTSFRVGGTSTGAKFCEGIMDQERDFMNFIEEPTLRYTLSKEVDRDNKLKQVLTVNSINGGWIRFVSGFGPAPVTGISGEEANLEDMVESFIFNRACSRISNERRCHNRSDCVLSRSGCTTQAQAINRCAARRDQNGCSHCCRDDSNTCTRSCMRNHREGSAAYTRCSCDGHRNNCRNRCRQAVR